ncbi:MAG UNVERIFIED_CONTAM: hypothetical protein LVT10_06410 [Anaerolineae bacterium]
MPGSPVVIRCANTLPSSAAKDSHAPTDVQKPLMGDSPTIGNPSTVNENIPLNPCEMLVE